MSNAKSPPLTLSAPLVFRYKLAECKFIAYHDPLAPLQLFVFHNCTRCPHLLQQQQQKGVGTIISDYSKCFIVETRCCQRLALPLPIADDAPAFTPSTVAVADADKIAPTSSPLVTDPDKTLPVADADKTSPVAEPDKGPPLPQLENDPECNGEDGVSIRLREPALRLLVDRTSMRFIPFNFELTMPFGLERAQNTPEYLAHELAESLLPLVYVRTPLLWVLLATPVREERNGNAGDWMECAATSCFLYECYRHILYSISRAAHNQAVIPSIQASIDEQNRDGSAPPQLKPMSNRLKEYIAEKAKRTQRFIDGMNALFKRYANLATKHLTSARTALQKNAAQTSGGQVGKQREILHKLTVRLLNTFEMHIMELCEVPHGLRNALLTPLSVPGAWKRLQGDCDERAVRIAAVALKRRVDIAALPPAPPGETDEEWEKRMDGMEDMYPPHISDDALRAIKSADHYNLGVLVPLLRDEVAIPSVEPPSDTAALVDKIDALTVGAKDSVPEADKEAITNKKA